MLPAGRIALVAVLGALLLAPAAGGQVGSEGGKADPFWFGPYYAGMALTGEPEGTAWDSAFSYGDCELPEGEGGCSVPLQVQNTTSCARNPLAIDRVPIAVFQVRGGAIAVAYESTAVDLTTGHNTVVLYSDLELMSAALRDIHRKSQSGPEPLAPPVYPRAALRELKRVTVAAKRYDGVKAISRAIGLPEAEVSVRLKIAELLGPEALAGVPAPTISIKTLERLRQLAFRTHFNPARTARKEGISRAALEKKVSQVRGLVGFC